MTSLFPGFEDDIFVSFCQKNNEGETTLPGIYITNQFTKISNRL